MSLYKYDLKVSETAIEYIHFNIGLSYRILIVKQLSLHKHSVNAHTQAETANWEISVDARSCNKFQYMRIYRLVPLPLYDSAYDAQVRI